MEGIPATNNTILVATTTTRVGIGTASPSSTLDVNGNLTMEGTQLISGTGGSFDLSQNNLLYINRNPASGAANEFRLDANRSNAGPDVPFFTETNKSDGESVNRIYRTDISGNQIANSFLYGVDKSHGDSTCYPWINSVDLVAPFSIVIDSHSAVGLWMPTTCTHPTHAVVIKSSATAADYSFKIEQFNNTDGFKFAANHTDGNLHIDKYATGGAGDTSNLFNLNSGGLGINLATPKYFLDVNGIVRSTGVYSANATPASGPSIFLGLANTDCLGYRNNGGTGNNTLCSDNGDNLKYNGQIIANSAGALNLSNVYNNLQLVSGSTITSNGTLSISTSATASTTGIPAIFIDSSGRVGISTTSPVQPFEVAGNAQIDQAFSSDGILVFTDGAGTFTSGNINSTGINGNSGSFNAATQNITGGNGFSPASNSGGVGGTIILTGGTGGNGTGTTGTITGGVGGSASANGGTGGNSTNSGTGTAKGGNGGGFNFTAGAGGNDTASNSVIGTGGTGGTLTFAAGQGGSSNGSTSGTNTGGNAGNLNFNAISGGAAQNSTGTNRGGNASNITFIAGTGGTATGTGGTTAIGGNGTTVTIGAGPGGTASGASVTNTNGNGGNIFLKLGAAGGAGAFDGLFRISKGNTPNLFEVTTSSTSVIYNQFYVGKSTLAVNNGMVGILTSSPAQPLDVNGQAVVRSTMSFGSVGNAGGVTGAVEFGGISGQIDGFYINNNSGNWVQIFSQSNPTDKTTWDDNGHMEFGGSAPSVASCGAAPAGSVVGNDNDGIITVGGGVVVACTLNFANNWTNNAICNITDSSASVGAAITASSPSSITIGLSATLGGGTIYYRCSSYR